MYSRFRVKNLIYLLSIIILTFSCSEESSQSDKSLYPEAEEQNIDGGQLAEAFTNAEEIDDLQGLVVARNNVIVAEVYFNDAGPEPDPNLHVMSVTKSISSTLIGIAIDKGFIESVNKTISDFLPDEVELTNPALGQVTIQNLLTMTCGHDWHEIGPTSEFSDFVNAPNQLDYIVNKPIINTPGTVFNYSDGAAHLISVILSIATGMDASDFANMYLFNPMGLGDRFWRNDKQFFTYGGVGLHIGNHDMIEIGNLYLNDGYYNEQQIVSPDWIDTVASFKISTNNLIPFLSDYGYFWWLGSAHGHEFFCANGYGGQFIFVVRELNLVVCSRSDYRGLSRDQAGENWYNILNIIINQILPAVRT